MRSRHEWQFAATADGDDRDAVLFRHCRACGRAEIRRQAVIDKKWVWEPWKPLTEAETDGCEGEPHVLICGCLDCALDPAQYTATYSGTPDEVRAQAVAGGWTWDGRYWIAPGHGKGRP